MSAEPAEEIAARFDFGAPLRAVRPHGRGLINDTYLVSIGTTPPRRAILQRINPKVFPQPQHIMQNLRRLLDHAQRTAVQVSPSGTPLRLPDLYRALDGRDFVLDADGSYWRALQFIENTRVLDHLANPVQAHNIGQALGGFHALLNELPTGHLHTTLPGFHIAPDYLAHFDCVSTRVAAGSDATTAAACEFVAARRALAATLDRKSVV